MTGISRTVTFRDWPELRGGTQLTEGLTRLVEFDTRPYVKRDTGQTEDSAAASDFASGVIVYSATDSRGRQYAGYAYEDPRVAETDKNPKATSKWFEAAASDRMAEWLRYAANALTGGDIG